MAQYDLLLTQNVHATLVEFSEKFVNIGKGGILSADASQNPTVLPVGTNGYMLVADSAETTGLKWQVVSAGHTQNTDIGTTSDVFELDSDGFQIELWAESASKFGVKVNGAATYADIEAKDATFNKVTVVTAPSAGSDLTNKTYVDGLLAANNAMVYKGTIDCSTNPNYPAADAGDTYIVSVAGKIGGASGPNVEVGDMLICNTDSTATGDHATVGAFWNIIQANIDGAVTGPASAVDQNFAAFNGTSGKVIEDSGYSQTSFIQTSTFTGGGQILYGTGTGTYAVLAAGTAGDVLQSNGASAPSWLTPGTMITEDAADYIAASIFTTANQILYSTGSAAEAALTVPEQTIVGRLTSGIVDALTAVEVMGILWQSAPATPTSTGTAGMIAYDGDYFYVCVATDTWVRSALALNWT